MLVAGCWLFFLMSNCAEAMGHVRDTISTSWPGTNANHTIIFMVGENIPPGGKIKIMPATSSLVIMGGFDYTDIDLATSAAANGTYIDRILGAVAATSTDGVAVITSTSSGSIAITLNSNNGIRAGDYVEIELGTQATYGEIGDRQIINASTTGVYQLNLQSFDASDNFLDRGTTFVVMIEPVTMTAGQPKIRSNGNPTGYLEYGTTQTIMSLNTNYLASCRYGTASGTAYADMSNDFTYTSQYFHSVLLTGLQNGQSYTYYVRCRDDLNVDDATDYLISFAVAAQEGDEGEETGTPGGGGGAGGGSPAGQGNERGVGWGNLLPYPPLPDLPGVAFSGWAYPIAMVTVLKDGQIEGEMPANSDAQFGAFLPDLAQGVYTFGLWATDIDGRHSITYSTTFWIDEGTQTQVSDIILPPTIAAGVSSVQAGQMVEVFGQSAPDSLVEVWLYPQTSGDLLTEEIIKREVIASSMGRWTAFMDTTDLVNGDYKIKARTTIEQVGMSEFGQILDLAVGGAVTTGLCEGADLNGDGRVNLTDFSILLYYWGTDDECADQNKDGTVNLTDFSIMMFYWTG